MRTRTALTLRPSKARLLPIAAFALILLASCDPVRPAPGAAFRDGIYVAAYSHPRSDGWRPYLQLRVRAGRLYSICFDAVRADGSTLLGSERFLEEYRLSTEVSLSRYLDSQIQAVLASQELRVRAAPAALEWSVALQTLLTETIDAARVGLTRADVGISLIPTHEPYLVGDLPDALGWSADLLLIHGGDGVAAVEYREVREELDGTLRVKQNDGAYEQTYESLVGITVGGATEILETTLIEAQSPGNLESVLAADALSGATISRDRFRELAERIDLLRSEVPLPDRLCR